MLTIHKQILYLASHRGSKEMDILLTGFVKSYLVQCDCNEESFLSLLQCNDADIHDWMWGHKESPKEFLLLVQALQNYVFGLLEKGPSHEAA